MVADCAKHPMRGDERNPNDGEITCQAEEVLASEACVEGVEMVRDIM